MIKIKENLKFSMNVAVDGRSVIANLELCNTGAESIAIPDDAMLLNSMYYEYPFFFSNGLDSKCETDSSGYKKNNISISKGCVHKTWHLAQECDFHDINHGTYTVRFEQVIECYYGDVSENILLGANSSFIL